MRPVRKLALKRETLIDLTADEMRDVAGADVASGATCPVRDCFDGFSDKVRVCDSILRPCISWGTCTTY